MQWCCPQNGATALILASNIGHVDVAIQLLDKGASMDLQDKVRCMLPLFACLVSICRVVTSSSCT